jgi:tetratricopeptide (TPR) repeat protein
MEITYNKLHRKPLFWIVSVTIIIVLFYYYPNIFLSGKVLYELGLDKYHQADHGDYNDWDKMRRAAFYFEKSIDRGYSNRDIYSRLSHCYWILNDKINAEKVYTLGIEQYPKDVEFHFYRGECRKYLKNFQGAFIDYDSVIKLNPKLEYIKDAYYDRGAMSYLLGDTVSANRDRSQVKKLAGFDWRTYEDYCRLWHLEAVSQ